MTAFFLNILEITVGMSVLVLVMLLALRLFGSKFTSKCRYVLWILVLVRLAIPFSLNVLPALIEVPIIPSITENAPDNVELDDPSYEYIPEQDLPQNLPDEIVGSTEIPSQTTPTVPTNPITPTTPVDPIIPITPTNPSTPSTEPNAPVTIDPPKEEILPPDPVTETPREPVSLTTVLDIVAVIYVAGAVAFFAWNLLSYLIYTNRIIATSRPADERTVSVFRSICEKEKLTRTPTLLVSSEINSPAAFGIFRRKVVLPDIEFSQNGLAGTLFHEVVHCKRGDLYIKLVELVARSLHWFNPLVHIAAVRCEMEMEMSCDERVLAGVSDDARVAYGRVMLDIIRRCRRSRGALTTHFNPKKNSVKSRFENIINGSGSRKGRVLIAICLVLCIVASTIIACTTEVNKPEDETPSQTETDPSETDPSEEETDPDEDETDPSTEIDPPIDTTKYVNVLENKVGLEFSTIVLPKNKNIEYCKFDEENILITTYAIERDADRNITAYSDFTLYLVNTMRGTLVDYVNLGDMPYRPTSRNYTANGLILSDWHLDDDGNMIVLGAVHVSLRGGRLSVVPTETAIYPHHDSILKSPDGRYTVYDTTDDGRGHGGIDVVYPDGTTKRILTNVMEGDPGVIGLGDVTGYSPIQFIDNDRFLYHIGGWEWTQGYGIYNLATGEKTEFREGYAAMGYWYGAIFLTKSRGYETVEWYMDTPEGGERRLLASVDEVGDESVFHVTSPADFRFAGTNWRTIYHINQISYSLNKQQLDINLYHLDIRKHYPDEEPNILAKVHYDTSEAEIYTISHDNRETSLIFLDDAPMPVIDSADAPIVNVIENNGALDVKAVFLPVPKDGGYMDPIKIDERHTIYITYEVEKNEETGKYYKTKPHFYLIDVLSGEIIDDYPYYVLSDSEDLSLFEVDYTDDGIIFMEMGNLGDRLGVMKAYRLTYDGALKFTPVVRIELYPYNSSKIVSPTGEYVVYGRDEGGYGDGGIDIVYAGGAKYRFLNNVSLDNAGGSLGAVTYYTPVGFADDSHLVYHIGGYEHIKGFGIYDLATGENKMFDDGKYQLSIVGDGVISFEEPRRNNEGLPEQYRTWSMTLDGKMTLTASVDEADGVPTMPRNISNRLRSEPIYSFTSRSFKVVPDYFYKTVSYVVESIYSPDMKEKLAVIEYPSDSNQRAVRNIHFAGDNVTIVLPVEPSVLSSDSEETPFVNVISNPGGLDVQTVYIPTYINGRRAYADIFEFDERYVICVTYDESNNDPTLYLIDTSLGQIILEEALTEYGTGGSVSYIDSNVALLSYYVEEADNRYRRYTEIRIENGAVQVIEGLADYVEYPRCDGEVKSTDGRYTAYNVIDDEAYHGGVDLLCPDGTVKRIKENYVILIEDGIESDVYGCLSRYSPLGFIDDKHLVIIAGAYESPSGYEIYNVETGELTQGLKSERVDDYYIEYSPAAISDGYLYLNVWKNGPITYDEEIIGVGKVDLDGNFVMIAHKYETEGVFILPEDEYFKIRNEVWHMYDSRFNAWSMKLEEFFKSTGYRVTKKFYSADFELLLELEYPYFTLKALNDVYVYGDTCTVITFTTKEKPAVESPTSTTEDVFRSILENKEKFRWNGGEAYFADLIDTRTVASSYTIIDLDGKGEAELVVSLEHVISRRGAGTFIFHREDDYVICHYIGPAYFVGLMADGSFQWSGDSGNGFAKLDFSGDSFTWVNLIRRVVVDYPEINYYINDKPVTDVEYEKYQTDLLRGGRPSWITLDYSREDSDEKAIESILSNKMPIRVVARDENMLLSDYTEYSGYAVKKYTMLDLDKDGGFELVLWLGFENSPYSYDYLVLHRDGDIWYAHGFTARAFNCLKGNGQYTSSSSAFNMTLLEIDFDGDSYTETKVAQRIGTGTEESIEYYVGGERASKAEFEKIYDRYDRISQPTWYSLDPDTVDDIENWRDIFAVWYPEDGSNPAPRIYELIDELVNAKSRIHEINELGITDYTIALMMESEYDAEVRLTFTVTGNSLPETLPPGTYTWTIYEGYDVDVTDYGDIPNPDAVPSYADPTRGMKKFGDYSAARAVNTFLQWNRYSDEFCPYGEWENNAEYTYPFDYICVYYGDEGYTITFDDLAALMDEKFGITVTRPERDGEILSRCRYDAAYDTVSYADTRGSFRPAHKIIDVVVDGDVTYVTVQLYAESLYLIPSHKVRYTIGEGDVFLGCEIIEEGKYEHFELN